MSLGVTLGTCFGRSFAFSKAFATSSATIAEISIRLPTLSYRWINAETPWIWQMRDGKALLLQAYGDPEQARSALGLGA